MADRTTIFVSYSRRDARWLQRLQVHLKPFIRRGDVDLWDDTKIDPGERAFGDSRRHRPGGRVDSADQRRFPGG